MGFVDFLSSFNQQVFISLYPAEVRSLRKSCWTLCSYMLHIFFLYLGFHPKPILFNPPAAVCEVTSVQIYTVYHVWHVVCVSVYLKPSSNCFLLIISLFLPSVYHRLVGTVFVYATWFISLIFSGPCTTCNYVLKGVGAYMTGKI